MKKFVLISAVALSLNACGFEVIDAGNTGVRVSLGEVNMKEGSLKEGFYTYNPFTTKIVEMDAHIQKWKSKTNTYTKDVQQADIEFVVNYRLKADVSHLVYKNVGKDWADILITQAVEGSLKKVVGQYNAVDLIEHRAKATQEALKSMIDSLDSQGVIIDRFEMVNIHYLKEFEKAVEDKVIATQKAVEEQNRTKQVQEQAKQTVVSAQAAAEAMRIKANALSQNAKLVEYEAVQKWDGKLPQYQFGNSTPFINISK